eukprot:COSAG05_NODE_2_length_63105_cov_159.292956_28_plen_91_part_00
MATCNTPVARVLGSRRTCRIMLLAAALLTLPRMSTVRADDGEVEEGEGEGGEAEEGAWSVSVCVYTGGGLPGRQRGVLPGRLGGGARAAI